MIDMSRYPQNQCEKDLAALKELVLEMFDSRDKALNIAYNALSSRLAGMNQFREQLSLQAATFISRNEHQILVDLINHIAQQVEINTHRLVDKTDIASYVTKEELELHIQNNERLGQELAVISERVASLESRFYLGGAGIVIILTCLQLLINFWQHL